MSLFVFKVREYIVEVLYLIEFLLKMWKIGKYEVIFILKCL